MTGNDGGARAYEIALSSALAGAAFNLAASMIDAPQALRSVPVVISCFAATLSVVLVVLGAATLLSTHVIRFSSFSPFRFNLAIASNSIIFVTLLPVLPSLIEDRRLLAKAVIVLILTSLFALSLLVTYRTLSASAAHRFASQHLNLLLSLCPVLAFAVAALVWVRAYMDEGALSGAAILAIAAVLLLVAATAALLTLSRRLLRPPIVLSAFLAATLLAPFVTAGYARLTATRHPSRADDESASRPSVILLTVDTLRSDFVSYYDPQAEPTEAIDSLLDDSVVFLNARSASPWTKPSMAAIHTGLSPLVTQVSTREALLPDGFLTLSEILKRHGYVTAAIGRNPYLTQSYNFQQGFDQYLVYPMPSLGNSLGSPIFQFMTGDPRYAKKPSTEALTDLGINWLTEHSKTPFFLWIHYLDPHLPYAPPSSYVPAPSDSGRVKDLFWDINGIRTGQFVPDAAEKARIRDLYAAEVQYVDDSISRLLATIRRLGLYSSSLIIFTSDHGEEFWEHNGYEHGHTLYDELLRIPLALKLSDSVRKGRLNVPVSNSRIMATTLDLLGMPDDIPQYASPSLRSSWNATGGPPPDCQVMSAGLLYYDQGIALICEEEKYIVFPTVGKELYFDLVANRSESRLYEAPPPSRLLSLREAVQNQVSQAATVRKELGVSTGTIDSIEDGLLDEIRSLGYVN